MSSWNKAFAHTDAEKFDVILRTCLICFVSFTLAVADIPDVIPPFLSFIPGVFGATMGFAVPKLILTPGLFFPSIFVMILIGLVVQSALLAAASVSDVLMVAVYALWVLWCTSLYFGQDFDKTEGSLGILCSLPGILALSYRPLVQAQGLSVVADLWTESGTRNPIAGNRNLLIVVCWSLACVFLVVVLPPFRTARSLFSRTLLPAAIMATVDYSSESSSEDRMKLSHFLNTLQPSSAGLTLFEPRLLRAPFENTVPTLQKLFERTDYVILMSLALARDNRGDWTETDQQRVDHAANIRGQCAKALIACDEEALENLKALKDEMTNLYKVSQHEFQESIVVLDGSVCLLDATQAWIDTMLHPENPSPCSKEGGKNLLATFLPWALAPLLPLKRLFTVPITVFRPSGRSLSALLWAVKYTIGLLALFVMSVYWTAYSEFAINASEFDKIGAVFYGWNLLSFTTAWTASVEGTAKHAAMRIIATLLGGVAAWIGVMVCSGSYDPPPKDINPYGIVVWLTVTTSIAASFSVGPGFMSRLGPASDIAKLEVWFVVTHSLLALEAYADKGSVNDLVVNRVVATVTGTLMAALIAALPPVVRGTDPKYAEYYLDSLKVTFRDILVKATSNDGPKIEQADFATSFKEMATFRRSAVYLLKNASSLQSLPIYKVDQRLMPLIEDMVTTEAILFQVMQMAVIMSNWEKSPIPFEPGTRSHDELRRFLSALDGKDGEKGVSGKNDIGDNASQSISANTSSGLFLTLIENTFKRIQTHESVVGELPRYKDTLFTPRPREVAP